MYIVPGTHLVFSQHSFTVACGTLCNCLRKTVFHYNWKLALSSLHNYRKLKSSTPSTKAKSWEPAYSGTRTYGSEWLSSFKVHFWTS